VIVRSVTAVARAGMTVAETVLSLTATKTAGQERRVQRVQKRVLKAQEKIRRGNRREIARHGRLEIQTAIQTVSKTASTVTALNIRTALTFPNRKVSQTEDRLKPRTRSQLRQRKAVFSEAIAVALLKPHRNQSVTK
jgi:hypothetical protein